ncbi:MAG: FtsK/SpoIIIE domain-containing protein [Monoglobaceae bacterium]
MGYNEFFALGQSAWCGADYIPTDVVEKSTDSSIQVVDNLGRVAMNIIPEQKRKVGRGNSKQIVSVVKYLSDLAKEENISVRPLWLEPIPECIFINELEEKYGQTSRNTYLDPLVGEYDDPFNQKRGVLTLPISKDGNCLIYGSSGSGKTTFLTTLCYSLINNHNANELNLYIIDFGSETLKAFERAPQVGGFITSSDEEMLINLFKMLQTEMNSRRGLFSDYGGDYAGYCKNSGRIVPNIVVVLNNYAGFVEQYEDLQDDFSLLSRDGVKYGIYFIVSASNTNAVRYRTQQNFKIMMTMQLNDPTDYSIIVGKTDGLIPSNYKGRGLVSLDRVYEFQTAYCHNCQSIQDFVISFCNDLEKRADSFAKRIPILPQVVDCVFVKNYIQNLSKIPVGVEKNSLNISLINILNRVIMPVVAQDISDMISFVEEFSKVLSEISDTTIIDPESLVCNDELSTVATGFDDIVRKIFDEMVERHNKYIDSAMDKKSLQSYDEKVYVVFGYKGLCEKLSADSKDKLNVLLEKAEDFYKIHFVLFDSVNQMMSQNYNTWYKKHVTGSEGVWIGDGFADQYMLKISKITSDLYDDIGPEYGYVIAKNRPTLVKLLASNEEVT